MNSGQVVVLVATLVAMGANWVSRFGNRPTLEHWSKPLATIGVVGLALVSGADRGSVVWATVALVLCLAGDVALLPKVDKFVVGLGSFLLGHLAFIGLWIAAGTAIAVRRRAGLGRFDDRMGDRLAVRIDQPARNHERLHYGGHRRRREWCSEHAGGRGHAGDHQVASRERNPVVFHRFLLVVLV